MATTKKKESTPASYKDAMEELEAIVAQVDDRNVDIDVLSEKVKRAHELIAYCQDRVEAVRFEIEHVLGDATPKSSVDDEVDDGDEPF